MTHLRLSLCCCSALKEQPDARLAVEAALGLLRLHRWWETSLQPRVPPRWAAVISAMLTLGGAPRRCTAMTLPACLSLDFVFCSRCVCPSPPTHQLLLSTLHWVQTPTPRLAWRAAAAAGGTACGRACAACSADWATSCLMPWTACWRAAAT